MNKILDKANVFEKRDRLDNIMFWATFKPTFNVYRYVGYEPDRGLHYFRQVRGSKAMLILNHSQIALNGLKPFCFNTSHFVKEE